MSGAIKKFLEVAIANFFGTEKDCQAKEILKLRVVFFGLIRLQRKKNIPPEASLYFVQEIDSLRLQRKTRSIATQR